VVRDILHAIHQISQEEGLTVLLVEQNAELALRLAQYGYVLETGRVVLAGTNEMLRNDGAVQRSYLGR
jgi:branched-chain amino acid transport system ATP-binding protein